MGSWVEPCFLSDVTQESNDGESLMTPKWGDLEVSRPLNGTILRHYRSHPLYAPTEPFGDVPLWEESSGDPQKGPKGVFWGYPRGLDLGSNPVS